MQAAWKVAKRNDTRSIKKTCKWLPPPQNALKLNVDGAVFHDQKFAGVGIILRSRGQVIMATTKKESEVGNLVIPQR